MARPVEQMALKPRKRRSLARSPGCARAMCPKVQASFNKKFQAIASSAATSLLRVSGRFRRWGSESR